MLQVEGMRELRGWNAKESFLGNWFCLLLNFKVFLFQQLLGLHKHSCFSYTKRKKNLISPMLLSNKYHSSSYSLTPSLSQLSSLCGFHCLCFQSHHLAETFLPSIVPFEPSFFLETIYSQKFHSRAHFSFSSDLSEDSKSYPLFPF